MVGRDAGPGPAGWRLAAHGQRQLLQVRENCSGSICKNFFQLLINQSLILELVFLLNKMHTEIK